MNDPRSSRFREGAAQRDLPVPSDLGYRARRVKRPRRGLTWTAEHIFYPRRTRKNTKRTMCLLPRRTRKARREPCIFYPRRTRKARREDFKENSYYVCTCEPTDVLMSMLSLPDGRCGVVVILLYPFSGIASIVLSSYLASSDIKNI